MFVWPKTAKTIHLTASVQSAANMNIDEAPIPHHTSQRLIGIELEFDAGGTHLNVPDVTPEGWSKKRDGSCHNGWEYVLEPPLTLTEAGPVVAQFCRTFVNTNLSRSGGFHVHVQSHDMDLSAVHHAVKIYAHFQGVINQLVGHSRTNNQWAKPYRQNVSESDIVSMFRLSEPATNRASAKCSRQYSVVNCAMHRCQTASHRTLEYRQGSPSKRFPCVYGWSAFMVAITCMGHDKLRIPHGKTLDDLVTMLTDHEAATGATNIGAWVRWRHEYLNREPTQEMLDKALALLQSKSGLFRISRKLDVNMAVAKRIIDKLTSQHLIRVVEGRTTERGSIFYQVIANFDNDLAMLEQAFMARLEPRPQ